GPQKIRAAPLLAYEMKVVVRAQHHVLAEVPDARVDGRGHAAELRRGVRRGVVGDDDVEIAVRLRANRIKRLAEEACAVVDRHPDRHERLGDHRDGTTRYGSMTATGAPCGSGNRGRSARSMTR